VSVKRFTRSGHMAIQAAALYDLFGPSQPPAAVIVDDVAIVEIQGPLTQHDEGWWDSYESIKVRAEKAFGSSAKAVVLKLCSPGGDAAGCYEASRTLRAMSARAGKPLYAYANGLAASAAYALACAAEKIFVPDTGFVGSIGVIKSLYSWAEADRKAGIDVQLVTSGARKSDGNPSVPITDDARAASQLEVDDLATLFFELVSESRGMAVPAVKGLEAGVFHGKRAVEAGLADRVSTFEGLLAFASGKSGDAAKESKMDLKEIVAGLKEAATGEGEEADKAKKMLATLEGEGEDEKKKDEDKDAKKAEDDGEKPKSEGEGEDDKKKDEDEEAAKASSAHARIDALERTSLLAQRPDITGKTRAWLEKAPLSTVRDALASIEKPKVPNLAAAAQASPTLPATVADARADRLPKSEAAALDAAMGISKPSSAIRQEGTRLILGVITPDQARAEIERRKAVAK
jgi:signal peptide peptidase SppA